MIRWMGFVWDSNLNDLIAKIVRLQWFSEYLCLVVSNLPVSLQTRSLEPPSAPLVDTRKFHLLVVPAPSSRRYNPRTVSVRILKFRSLKLPISPNLLVPIFPYSRYPSRPLAMLRDSSLRRP